MDHHRMQDLPFDPGRLDGLSERLLRSHHENNYGGAVRRLNAIQSSWPRWTSPPHPASCSTG